MNGLEIMLLVGGAPLVVGGLIYAWWAHPHARFTTVSAGRLFHSGAMPPAQLLRVVRKRRIDTVVDFRSGQDPAVEAERSALATAGVRHMHLPTGIYPTAGEIDAFVEFIATGTRPGDRILMHCEDGEGRAVMFGAIYRMQFEGWEPRAAYLASARLPDSLRFLGRIIPGAGCLSSRNVKTGLILNYRRRVDIEART